nr:NAK protein kinase [Kwoniella dejecticola CBS 10117]OBR85889.1 NAK protein kinase [Kwoniella dejecticola CBS 10117]
MPSGQSSHRYQQYPNPSQQYARAPPNRYSSPLPPAGYANGNNGYPQQPQQQPLPPPQRHKGTLAPGQIVKVGDQTVRIERYLSEGGYAHVYLTTSDKPIYPPTRGEKKGRWGEKGYAEHCLKRIAFEDDAVWIDVKKEIEVMKSLPPNPHLIQYLGSAHSRLPSGGHEVFVLMEFCSGGGIIDLLNKRLRDRLKEIEILNIFTDVCEAVAAMHHLSKPLLHRDLKIENVLSQPISTPPTPQRPSSLMFKLCDFGSTTFPADKPPQSKVEADALAMDLNKHTTLQYRSPEMVEPMLGLPVGLPSDVWALGCLLYKLCYYTTPFEEHGPLAIVNAKYTFPPVPAYSPRIQHLIASMLMEQPVRRPTVFEVLRMAHEMSGTKPEIDYPIPSRSLSASTQQRQPSRPSPQSSNLLDFTGSSSPMNGTPVLQPSLASSVQPQRRGRPTREPSQKSVSQLHTSASMPTPPQLLDASVPQAPKIQVTGDRSSPAPGPAPKASPGLDAFGMPSLPSSASQKAEHRGFGDSFAAPTNKTSTSLTGGSRFGANLPRPPSTSGFGDSFSTSRTPASAAWTPGASALNRAASHKSASSSNKQSSPVTTVKSPEPTTSSNGDASFETRFPSLETLDSDHFSPPPQQSGPKPEAQISPVALPPSSRPTFDNRPSIMGNMTGGDLKSPVTNTAPTSHPQPRSTHVTGTAFKESKSPSSPEQKTDYFGSIASSASAGRTAASPAIPISSTAKSPLPQDLMDDDQSGSDTLRLLPIHPGRSVTPTSANSASRSIGSPNTSTTSRPQASPGGTGSAQAAPTTGHHRPLLPHIDSAKPNSNINSEEWSPLEKMRFSKDEERKVDIELDSSDEDAFPEDASATKYKPLPSPTKVKNQPTSPQKISDRASAFEGLSPTKSKPVKSATVGIPPTTQRVNTGERSRPQSMFVTPSSSSNKGFNFSASPSSASLPRSDNAAPSTSARPSHGRKGSINDMVSRYENLKPPSSSAGEAKKPSPATNGQSSQPTTGSGLGRKPSVASKPQALRKPTLDQPPSSSSAEPSKSPTISTKPVSGKPPLIAPKPVRHDEAPRPEGFSRSSSGRAFPITKPKPTINTAKDSNGKIDEKDEGAPASAASGKSSPEKQQSVNSLIARWNQGQTANANANKVVPKRGGYI